jgi:hypothetical protein
VLPSDSGIVLPRSLTTAATGGRLSPPGQRPESGAGLRMPTKASPRAVARIASTCPRLSRSQSGRQRLRGDRGFRACVIKPPLIGRSIPIRLRQGGKGSITPGLACCSPLTGLTDTLGEPPGIVKTYLSDHVTRQLDTSS